jgi:hypothetical protein
MRTALSINEMDYRFDPVHVIGRSKIFNAIPKDFDIRMITKIRQNVISSPTEHILLAKSRIAKNRS